ncbi:MAG: hydrogenase 2 operon protein HybA [Myxococcales bacterium]
MPVSRRSLLKGALFAGAAAALAPEEAKAREVKKPSDQAVGLLYDATRCVGCKGCVIACKDANDLPWDDPKELSSSTKSVVQKKSFPPVRSGGEPTRANVKRQCMHCVDPPCVSACMLGALHKEGEGKRDMGGEKKGTGIVLYDKALCVGCRYCQIACAFAVPKFEWFEAVPRIVKCELCRRHADSNATGPTKVANPACARTCPAEAVIFGYRTDLLAEAHKRLAEDPEAYSGKVYGESDGGGTGVLYLAPKDVTFGQLGFPELPEYSNAYLSEKVSHAPYLGGITPLALYAAAAFVVRRNKAKEAGHHEPTEQKAAPKADEKRSAK